MEQTKWIERKFSFDFPITHLPNILERLRGTPVRLEAMIAGLAKDDAEHKPDNKWSIKEHIGHLGDLEYLHEGRIDDFQSRKPELRAADMTNAATNTANHNLTEVSLLLKNFAKKRAVFVSRLEKLNDQTLNYSSLHPRLKIMMRPVDMAFFTAEHDDHHLASIRKIISDHT